MIQINRDRHMRYHTVNACQRLNHRLPVFLYRPGISKLTYPTMTAALCGSALGGTQRHSTRVIQSTDKQHMPLSLKRAQPSAVPKGDQRSPGLAAKCFPLANLGICWTENILASPVRDDPFG